MTDAACDTSALALARLRQEATDLRDRARPSGVFYLIGWLVVGQLAGAFERAPWPAFALTLLLVLLALARLMLKLPELDSVRGLTQFLRRAWILIYLNIGSWSVIALVVQLVPVPEPARISALICTVMYGSAFGYAYCMRRGLALGGLLLVAGPVTLALWWRPGDQAIALAFTIYLAHLLLVAGTSYRGYQQRLDLDQELRRQRNLYEQLSRIDALTGLYNRGHFNGHLREMLESGAAFGFALIDIDHFKRINDHHGHAEGDRCLQRLAELLRLQFNPQTDYLARIGGEEFALILPGRSLTATIDAANALRAAVRGDRTPPLPTLSVGVSAVAAGERVRAEALYHEADSALYAAKAQGRDRVCVARHGSTREIG